MRATMACMKQIEYALLATGASSNQLPLILNYLQMTHPYSLLPMT